MASRGAALRGRRRAAGSFSPGCRALLCLGTLACSLLGAFSDLRGGDPEYQLDVTLQGSVLLSASVPSDQLPSAADWDFEPPAGGRVLLVESQNGKPPEIKSQNAFGRRLEVINMTCLRIRDLERGDGGTFRARVKFQGGAVEDYLFTLTLHEPVPSPQVNCSVTSRFPEGCNMTLYCQGAGSGEFEIWWAKGEPPQALEEGPPDGYWLSGSGTALRLSWRFGSSHLPYTCLISNAAEKKRASLEMASCCRRAGANETSPLRWLWYLLTIVVAVAVILGSLWVWRRRRRRTPSRGPSKTEQSYQARYLEMMADSGSPESSCGQPHDPVSVELRPNCQTVYAALRSGSHLYEEAT